MITTYQRRKLRIRKAIKSNNKNNKARVVVTRSNKNIYAQIIDIDGKVLLQESSNKINEKISGIQKSNIVGEKLAKKCKESNIVSLVFDKGAYNYNGRVKAIAESLRNNGLKI